LLPRPTSLTHLHAESPQYATGLCTFRKCIITSSPAHPSNKRNGATAHWLSLASIVTFRFWRCTKNDENVPCEAIAFKNRNPNIMDSEMFREALRGMPPSAIRSV
jgi:hypothetical protein